MEEAFAREAERVGADAAARAVGRRRDRLRRRRAPHRAAARPRRDGRGLRGGRGGARPHGRVEARRARAGGRAGVPRALHRRVAAGRVARSPERAAGLRGGRGRRGCCGSSMRLVDGADLRSLCAARAAAGGARSWRRSAPRSTPRTRAGSCTATSSPRTCWSPRSDHAYLTDFGLVKALDATAGLTRTGDVVGTLDYVAPERIRGAGDGPAADLYSLGCVLYYALTGRVVFARRGRRAQAVGAPVRAAAGRSRASTRCSPARWPRTRRSGSRAARSSGRPRSPPPGRLAGPRSTSPAARRRGSRAADPAARRAARRRPLAALEHAVARAAADRARRWPTRRPSRSSGGSPTSAPGQTRARRSWSPRWRRSSPSSAGCRPRSTPSTPTPSGSCVELETVRGRVLADEAAAAERLGALQDELATLAARLAARRWGIHHLGSLFGAARAARPSAAMSTIANKMRRKGRRALHRELRVPARTAQQARRGARRAHARRRRPRRPARLVPRLPLRRRRADRHALQGRRRRLARDDPADPRVHRLLPSAPSASYLHHTPDSTLDVPMSMILPTTLQIVDAARPPDGPVHRRRRRRPRRRLRVVQPTDLRRMRDTLPPAAPRRRRVAPAPAAAA